MSDETFRLLTSSDALDGYLVGFVGLLLIGIWAMGGKRPVPIGGLALAGCGVAALAWTYRVPTELLLGVALLAVAGLVPTQSHSAAMALTVPGAVAIGAAFVDSPRPEIVVFVVVAIVVLGRLVVVFDVADDNVVGMPLFVISMFGVLVTVPDTDQVIVVAATAAPLFVAGYPFRLARLGGGAPAATGLLIWAVAVGGSARTGAIVAGTAALGLLVAGPVMQLLRGSASRADRSPAFVVGVQGLLAVLLALAMSAFGEVPLAVGFVSGLLLIGAGSLLRRSGVVVIGRRGPAETDDEGEKIRHDL